MSDDIKSTPRTPPKQPVPPPKPQRWRIVATLIAALAVAVAVAGEAGVNSRQGPSAVQGSVGRTPAPISTPSSPVTVTTPINLPPDTESVSFALVGDITFSNYDTLPVGGMDRVFDYVRGDLESDVTMGNLETVIGNVRATKCAPRAAGDGSPNNCYTFVAHPDAAKALSNAGFAAVNLANNHSNDAGAAGVADTQAALKAAGVKWTGKPGQIEYIHLDDQDLTVAILGFAPYSSSANLLDINGAKQLVAKAKKKADLVIVYMHVGAEGANQQHVRAGSEVFLGEDRGNPIAFSHAVIDAGADLVFGSGPHVLRGMQWYKGKLIAYSLGNFSGYNTLTYTGVFGISAILHVTLDQKGNFLVGSLTPIVRVTPGVPKIDVTGTAISQIKALSQADFAGNGAVKISNDGTIQPPA